MGLTVLCGVFSTFNMNVGKIVRKIMPFSHDIVMVLNNVMNVKCLYTTKFVVVVVMLVVMAVMAYGVWTTLFGLRATPHTRLRACDHYTSSTLLGGKRQSQSKFSSHCTWGTNGVCECRMGGKSTCIPTWHQMDHVSRSLELLSKTNSRR